MAQLDHLRYSAMFDGLETFVADLRVIRAAVERLIAERDRAREKAAELQQAIIGIVRDGIINAPCPTPAQWKQVQIEARPHLDAALREER